jgi:hypothetical protein
MSVNFKAEHEVFHVCDLSIHLKLLPFLVAKMLRAGETLSYFAFDNQAHDLHHGDNHLAHSSKNIGVEESKLIGKVQVIVELNLIQTSNK